MDADAQKAIAAVRAENAQLRAELGTLKEAFENRTVTGLPGSGDGIYIPDNIQQAARGGGGGGSDGPTVEVNIAIAAELVPYLIKGEPA
jgi:hypothetical protein